MLKHLVGRLKDQGGWIPLAIAGAGILAQYLGQQQTNQSNETIANNATAFNAQEAANNRRFQAEQTSAQQAFQERMSSTAHQREMADMKAAGINPMLTAKGVGASTPSGAAASGAQATAQTAKLENPFSGLANTALDALQISSSLKKQAAEIDYIRTQEKVATKSIPEADIKNRAYDWFNKKIDEIFKPNPRNADVYNRNKHKVKQKPLKFGSPFN